jgi:hypothetical protein
VILIGAAGTVICVASQAACASGTRGAAGGARPGDAPEMAPCTAAPQSASGFKPSPAPGRLAPEDLRLLALNRRALPDFRLGPQRDFPPGYPLNPRIIVLAPMPIPGPPDYDGPLNGP